jgi:DNA-binding NarL/FixJ family response regulator
MLNDKEKDLKAAVREIDSSKKKVQDIIESKVNADKTQAEKVQAAKAAKLPSQGRPSVTDFPAEKSVKTINPQPEVSYGAPVQSGLSSNNNSQILSLYSQGKTIIEISKLLGLGQGEVKLVIDLFKGKK